MIVGMNEKLEKLIDCYHEAKDDTDFTDVMNCIVKSAAVGDYWHIPVNMVKDGMNETDFKDGWILEQIPAFSKKTVNMNKDGEEQELFCAFTSEDKIKMGGESELITVKYPAIQFLRELVAAEECPGLILNPWSNSFAVSRQNATEVLDFAEHMPSDSVRALRAFHIEPRAIIDTNVIVEQWKDGWNNEDGKQEDWKLINYPIMADGRVLLLFEMRDEILGGKYDALQVIHTHSHYRVLEYQMEDNKLMLKNQYRFKSQDSDVGCVFLYDGVLRATISVTGRDSYSVMQMEPVNDDAQFSVYSCIESTVSNSKGDIIIAYNNNLRDEGRLPVMSFDSNGEVVASYYDEMALACLDVNIDKDESIWFHIYPSTTLDKLNAEERQVETHKVAMQGFNAFAMSTDRSKLFVQFTDADDTSVQFIMSANANGDYIDPIRFDFKPTDSDGNTLEAKDCNVFGRASTTKSWVILNADGKLYLYNIDDCCD